MNDYKSGNKEPNNFMSLIPFEKTVDGQKYVGITQKWGPTSNSGIIYKYNRGAIGITQTGKSEELSLDENGQGHIFGIYSVSLKLGKRIIKLMNLCFQKINLLSMFIIGDFLWMK